MLPTGDLVTRVASSSYSWDGVTWHTATYAARNTVAVLHYLENFGRFTGLMGEFPVRFQFGPERWELVGVGMEVSTCPTVTRRPGCCTGCSGWAARPSYSRPADRSLVTQA